MSAVALLADLAGVAGAALQDPGGLASQSLRPYWHVFIAYALVWATLFGWIVSIHRRLKDVEEQVSDG